MALRIRNEEIQYVIIVVIIIIIILFRCSSLLATHTQIYNRFRKFFFYISSFPQMFDIAVYFIYLFIYFHHLFILYSGRP